MIAVMYVSMAVAVAVFAYGSWRRIRVWRAGRPGNGTDAPGRRLRSVVVLAAGQARMFRRPLRGILHAGLAYGFVVLFLATVVVFVDSDLGVHIMQGPFYLYFQSLAVDAFGIFALAGAGFYLVRALRRRARGERPSAVGDLFFTGGLVVLLLTGFLMEGLRIGLTDDPWRAWSPGGNLVATLLGISPDSTGMGSVYRGFWVFHVLLWHSLLALLPFTRFRHAVLAPVDIFLATPQRSGLLPAIDFEAPVLRLGIREPRDLTRKQLLDLDTCTECGRCTDVCPAALTGKPLSPRSVIVDLRDHVRAHGLEAESVEPLARGVIAPEALWACTTCRACEEACPVGIEHVSIIVGLRRNLAMEQAEVPTGIADLLQSLESRQHPFRGAPSTRSDWCEGLPVRRLADLGADDRVEVVYWVGCSVVGNRRVQDVARAFVRLLVRADVEFAIAGEEEVCCGEPARRTGNEFHYQELAQQNVDLFRRYGASRIVTHCPHCLQTIGQDYAQMGLEVEILHHSQFLEELIESGRLRVDATTTEEITFHDPCYLGRYNRVFDAPRNLLDRAGAKRIEMVDSGPRSLCCGGGGGNAFHRGDGRQINHARAEQAVATAATTLATACPFCLTMLEDGLSKSPGVRVRDIAEILADGRGDAPEPDAPRG